ncbi:MAG: phage tail tape measure protein [Spirochaetaceae bacterium]|jgi:hypothetical protein|nr:phage tail tape measure protein [Spirochaetaceae bacterium]
MAEIKSGVILKLKDEFSKGMGKAAGASGDFAGRTLGALDKVNSALSGTAAKIGAFGVTLSLGAAAKEIIEIDHRMTRLGLTASASAEQVTKLKQQIFETAQSPDIKIDPKEVLSGLEVVMEKVGDIQFVEDNIRNIGLAIQATGESGGAMGDVFSEFAKFGYTAEQVNRLLDDMVAQGDQGAFTFAEFAKNAPAVFSAYSVIGTSPEHMKKANAAMQILVAGTKSPEIAVTALNSAMNELSDPDKQEKLGKLGIAVRDGAGQFRDFNDIMFDIVNKAKEMGNADYFGTIFGSLSMNAIRSYVTQGERMYSSLIELGDTSGLMQSKAAAMAGTLKSNLSNLQTAFVRFADSNLTAPLAKLTDFLNKLAEDPKRVEAVFNSIKRGFLIIGGIKIGAGVMSFLSTLKNFKGGSASITTQSKITEQLSLAGGAGAAMPVFVTNWNGGGMAGGSPLSGQPPGAGGLPGQSVNPIGGTPPATPGQTPKGKWNLNKPNWKGAGIAAGGAAAVTAILTVPGMINELGEISKNEEMTKEEKSVARGGAIGETVGSIGGAAAGALAGAAIGSVVPVVGTAVGALIGGLIGQFGGPLGRFIGEKVGAAVGKEVKEKIPSAPPSYAAAYGMVPASNVPPAIMGYNPYAPEQQAMRFDGSVGLQTDLYIHQDGTFTATQKTHNNTEFPFATGHAPSGRVYN